MIEETFKLLMLEDNSDDVELIKHHLKSGGINFTADVVQDKDSFLNALHNNKFDAVLADNSLPQYNSAEALKIVRSVNAHTAFVLVTGTVSEEYAVKIIQQGADDYILKTSLTRLPSAVKQAIQRKRIQKEKDYALVESQKEKELSNSIINSLPGIFCFYDKHDGFLRWNLNFETVTGFSCDEIRTMHPWSLFETANESISIKDWIDNVLLNQHATIEANLTTKHGKSLPYFLTGSAVRFHGQDCLVFVGLDISSSKKTAEELKELNTELQEITTHLENIREEEQSRIAREVHDQLGQLITAMKMDTSWIKKRVAEIMKHDVQLLDKLSATEDLLDEAAKTVRKVAADLRPPMLEDFGLVDTLNFLGKEFSKRYQIKVHFNSSIKQLDAEFKTNIGLYRIFQEAFTNIARHAEAKNIYVSLDLENGLLTMQIKDDGKGFDVDLQRKTLGLIGMRERAKLIGGSLLFSSVTGNGTNIKVVVQLWIYYLQQYRHAYLFNKALKNV